MGVFQCPLPCNNNKLKNDPDQSHDSNHVHPHSDTSSGSSSLHSQPSLPSVPSLTPHEKPASSHTSLLATLKGHSAYVSSLSLAGKHLYSGSSDGEIRVWNRIPPTSDVSSSVILHNVVAQGSSGVKSIVILGNRLFTAHHDHKIRVWKIDQYENNDKHYKCIATLPTLNDRCSRFFSAKNYVQVRRHKKCTWVHHVDAISALALSKDGSFLYSVSWDRTLKMWRTSDYKCLESIWNAHDDAINAIALPNDGFIYTGSADRKIKVWKKYQGDKKHSLVATLEKHKSAVNALALSTDGSVLYSGACDRSIIVWVKDGGNAHMVVSGALRGHTKAILCLTVVSDLVFSGSADKTVRVWKRGLGKSYSCLAVLEGHKGPVKCLTSAAEEDGKSHVTGDCDSSTGRKSSFLVYSGSLDRDLRIWNVWVQPN
ncbi:OLC1v1028154C1 [Oldenlandia corymbosa var. corymbosa]|uniref:OLC1v1028154C1 n=1 Tax=Oldenlandia corymbosa var. corymbosa TaxID=529605 RepID=A0AAV1CDS2_OLDCO|nr:OLC1v1028154C1 [Oldenlandia corymbosa var. corymbosa]